MHFKHYENPYSGLAQYVNCAAANSGADAGMYDASSEIHKLSTKSIPEIREREGNEKIHSHNSEKGIRSFYSWEWTGTGIPAHPC